MNLVRQSLRCLPLLGALALTGGIAQAEVAHVTADNHYALYYGLADGSNLTFIGRNEVTDVGSSGGNAWSNAETWNYASPGPNYRIYVVAWDDGGQQMWGGDFTSPTGLKVSDTTNWQSWVSTGTNDNPLNSGGALPLVTTLAAQITSANSTGWGGIGASAPNGTAPWGSIATLNAADQFIWHDTLDSVSSSDSHYVIYRSTFAVPEASPGWGLAALAGAALGFKAWQLKRQTAAKLA
ncbi:MAG TPA: hypothetical protein VMB21_07240 [Candidatus Limnocylindria bacterium]|nr:hypothetical protein [Candidatus Limnocylindria bacterium]